MLPSLDIVHLITKPVVDPQFLQDWLGFLSSEQDFRVHLLYSDDSFDDQSDKTLAERFPGAKLHRIEKATRYKAKEQAFVFLADYLDLRYLARSIPASLVHSHDTKALFLARMLFPNTTRLHSWWMEDRNAHRLWRVTVERLADFRTWETVESEAVAPEGPLASLAARQIPLPTPESLTGEYERGACFSTIRELYRNILRDVDIRQKSW